MCQVENGYQEPFLPSYRPNLEKNAIFQISLLAPSGNSRWAQNVPRHQKTLAMASGYMGELISGVTLAEIAKIAKIQFFAPPGGASIIKKVFLPQIRTQISQNWMTQMTQC